MQAESVLALLLAAQGVVGGVDTLLNHELIEHLPRRPSARREIGLHSLRESIYGTLFAGLAFVEWHGAWAWALPALLAAEVLVTASDEWIENRTRVLPQNERVMHVFLTLNLGLLVAVAIVMTPAWLAQPTSLTAVDRGWLGWLLLALGAAGFAWSLRDLLAWRRWGTVPFGDSPQ